MCLFENVTLLLAPVHFWSHLQFCMLIMMNDDNADDDVFVAAAVDHLRTVT